MTLRPDHPERIKAAWQARRLAGLDELRERPAVSLPGPTDKKTTVEVFTFRKVYAGPRRRDGGRPYRVQCDDLIIEEGLTEW